MYSPSVVRMASPDRPLPLKSTARTTSAVPGVGKIVGLDRRPSPRPESRPKVSEPGLRATTEGKPPGVNVPTVTPVVPSRVESGDGTGVPVTPYGPGPAR